MQSKTNIPHPNSNRLIVVMVSALILGVVWAFISRMSEPSSRQPGPPANPKAGSTAPDFTLDLLDGGRLTLSELQGHPVVLNVWATWCYPCRQEMPAIEKVYQRYKEMGLVVIGLNLTSLDSESDVGAFAREFGLTFPIVLDRDGSVSARYQFPGLPTTFFIDRSGIIHSIIVGGPMSEAAIQSSVEDLLQEK